MSTVSEAKGAEKEQRAETGRCWPCDRSETKLLLTKEPKQEVRFWMPTELQPQTPTLFSVSGGVAAHYSDVSGAVYHQRFLNPIQGREDARCNSELRGRGE